MTHSNPLPTSPDALTTNDDGAEKLARDILERSGNDPLAALINAARIIQFLETKTVSTGFVRGHLPSTSDSLIKTLVH